jgi:O-antigen ligase
MLLPIFIAATLFCFFMIPFLQLIFGNDATSLNQIDAFLSGRLNAILFEIKAISESSLWQKILGHGAGQLDVQLSLHQPVPWAKVFPEPTNPHNDYLKILFDFGIAGSFAYAISLQSRYTKTQFGFALLVFSWTLFFFENALIHIYFNMISAILLQAFENEQKNESLVRG